ncbi:MAG: hypothetical protein ACF8PN_02665 [Phycisphaerales bacterium]
MSPRLPFKSEPLEAQSVTNIDFDAAGGECDVVFNTIPEYPLSDVSGADPVKWSARIANRRYEAVSLSNGAYDRLHIVWTFQAAEIGANEISYSNAPSDISDELGRELAAFTFSP